MKIKGIIDEDFVNYSKPSMYVAFPSCTFKCDKDNQCEICQNSSLACQPDIEVTSEQIVKRYLANPITKAIVVSGLEPFDTMIELISLVCCLRSNYHCMDDIVIYTGYTEDELSAGRYGHDRDDVQKDLYKYLCNFPNIIIKFGRFIMNDEEHIDPVLGVKLASHNQYAKRFNYEEHENL